MKRMMFLAVALLAASNTGFSYTWHQYNGHEYAITSHPQSWVENEAEAEGLGGYLAVINSVEENTWLTHTFAYTYNPMTTGWNDGYVDRKCLADIGYYRAGDGTWKWVNGEAGVANPSQFYYRNMDLTGDGAYLHVEGHGRAGTWHNAGYLVGPWPDSLYEPAFGIIERPFTPPDGYLLTTSAGSGGTVTMPGIGTFRYEKGETVTLKAVARPGFVFAKWSGDLPSTVNPTYLSITADRQIKANFASLLDTIYVDAHAPDDPEPNDPSGSDPNEDGTPEHPFDSVQEAIDVANAGVEILVNEGLYPEQIDLTGKTVVVRVWLQDPNGTGEPVIDGRGTGPVATFGADANSVLSGFRIQGGRARTGAAVLFAGARGTMSNCLIVGNRVDHAEGGVIDCHDSNAVFVNCTIQGNITKTGVPQASVFAGSACRIAVSNSIIWGNPWLTLTATPQPGLELTYCILESAGTGAGNLDMDPLFARPGHWDDAGTPADQNDDYWVSGDYHLQSQGGRWEPVTRTWLTDAKSSPSIDAGDPDSDWSLEPQPNGGRINMGAYGGTTQASKSP